MNVDGSMWWTTEQATAQLGVSAGVLRQWVYRSKAAGHARGDDPDECTRCQSDPAGFPHLDPPVRSGRLAGYRAQQLLDAEAYTAGSPRGGSRRPA